MATKIMLRHLPPAITDEDLAALLSRALAPLHGVTAMAVYMERGKVKKDRSIVPSRACLDVRIPPEPTSGLAFPEHTEAVLRALSSQTLTDAQGEPRGRTLF